ncbi:methyltransferase domain-containing protein [Quadrisphaera sp. INWT6]|uniref:methyltransferase domain-containing protein n=1 Tax=Quadrisphaera sp. INWT6 TaxID=2596917 RepID=UPI001892274B|nr:methyltransferase domain-containing protein [Quadrisphaera sp. INWT6]
MGRHERVAELAQLDAEGLVVADVGCGSGRTVRALLAAGAGGGCAPAVVHALDHVSALDDDLLADPRVRSRIADLDSPLPWGDGELDRVVSLNAAEHLTDPVAHLAEVHRVLRPGGLCVLAHSDWDTALFTSTDDVLTRQLVDGFTAANPGPGPSDGFMGRKLLALAATGAERGAPWEVVTATSWADPHRRFDDGSLAWKVATGVLAAAQHDPALLARAAGWMEELRALAAAGQFLFAVTDVAVVLRRA